MKNVVILLCIFCLAACGSVASGPNTISGTVFSGDAFLPGATVTLSLSGTPTGTATTDAHGNYSFTGLQNGSYTVTPTISGYSFTPASRSVTVNGGDTTTGINFTALVCHGTMNGTRWCDEGDGTIRDMITGLFWLKNANCLDTAGGISKTHGYLDWAGAQTWAAGLASGTCGLTDSSVAGNWRVPTKEGLSTVTSGTEAVLSDTPRAFSNVRGDFYWSSSNYDTNHAWYVYMGNGNVFYDYKDSNLYVWPVRSGQ